MIKNEKKKKECLIHKKVRQSNCWMHDLQIVAYFPPLPTSSIYAVDKSRAWTLSVTNQDKVSLITLRNSSALRELK